MKNKRYLNSMKLPLFSIITVTFNAESEIERTLESVASQTYSDYEFIIIDGKSKDKTVELVSSHPVHS